MKTVISEEDWGDTINSMPVGMLLLGAEKNHRFIVRAINDTARLLFQTVADPVGLSIQDWQFNDEILERMQRNCEACVASNEAGTIENPFVLKDGSIVWSNTTVVPIKSHDNTVTALLVTTVNVTELVNVRRARERELALLASGYVTLCAWCNSIRENDQWISVDEYLIAQPESHAESHAEKLICPDCAAKS